MSKRGLGNCTKSYSRHNHYFATLEEKRLCFLNRITHPTQPISLRTAVYETRTYGGVRGALRQFLAEPSTRLPAAFLVLNTVTLISTTLNLVLFYAFKFAGFSICSPSFDYFSIIFGVIFCVLN